MTELGSHEDMDGNLAASAASGGEIGVDGSAIGEIGTSCDIFLVAGALSETRGAFAPREVAERAVSGNRS